MEFSPYVQRWLAAFILTQLVEVPLYVRLAKVRPLVAFGATAITHPTLWFVLFPVLPFRYQVNVVVAEVAVWAVEAAYLARVGRVQRRTAVWVAFVVNAASVVVGHISRTLFGWP